MQSSSQTIRIIVNQPGPPHPIFEPPPLGPLGWERASRPGITIPPALAPDTRCSEKGCVFPAALGAHGKCLQHHRQASEPIFFSSHQPTRVVLERGRFGIPEREVDTSRNRDRRQLAAIREAFLED